MKRRFLALAVMTVIMAAPGAARDPMTFYVSPDGSDSNPGTEESPFLSPAYGCGKMKAGDTLMLLPGTYVIDAEADILRPKTGKSTGWIMIDGKIEGVKRPILAGRDGVRAAIDLAGKKFVKVANIEITHDTAATGDDVWFSDGITVQGKIAMDIALENLYIHHVDNRGLNIQDADRLTVTNCKVEYCGGGAIGGPTPKQGGWKNVKLAGSRFSYSGKYYRGGTGAGRPDLTPDGIGAQSSVGPVEISGCVVEKNYGDGIESRAANTYAHEVTIANNTCNGLRYWADMSRAENCLIYGMGDGDKTKSEYAGIMVEGIKSGNPRFYFTNVTVDDNRARDGFMAEFQRYASGAITVVAKNCIFANGGGAVCFYKTVKATVDHCLFLRPGAGLQVEYEGEGYKADEIEAGKIGPGNLSRDPKFVKRSWGGKGDYHLQASSPCLDAGTATGAPSVDLAGTSRPQGDAVDMGAYEQ